MRTALSIIVLLSIAGVAQDRKVESPAYMVRFSESVVYFRPTAEPSVIFNCAIVYRDGRLNLGLRRQEFIGGGDAILHYYESQLTREQLGILKNLLQAPSIQQLSAYTPPMTPMTSSEWRAFAAEIARESKVQKVGYFAWQGDPPMNPDTDKNAWRDASIKLQPLVDWFHALKSYHKSLNWREVKKPNSVCGE